MEWRIDLGLEAQKTLNKIEPQQAKRILKFLFERISPLDNPRDLGEALKGKKFENLWKYRIGDYRAITSIQDKDNRIIVIRIGNRREVYR